MNITRLFPPTGNVNAYAAITARRHDHQGHRPCAGGALVMTPPPGRGTYLPQTGPVVQWPLPAAVATPNGAQPWMGMDPSDPSTWVREYRPQPGMVSRLNFDGATAQSNTPMGQTWRNRMHDRAGVPATPEQRLGRIRRTRRTRRG